MLGIVATMNQISDTARVGCHEHYNNNGVKVSQGKGRVLERESFKQPTVEVFDLSGEAIVTSGCGCGPFEGWDVSQGGSTVGGGTIADGSCDPVDSCGGETLG